MSNPHLQFPELNGGPIDWPGGETGVLLIHGLTATVTEVRLLAEKLREHHYSIAAPLLPGHGTSPADANRVTYKDWLAHCQAAYAELDARCERVFIGGESTGAALALHLAADHPEIAGVLAYAPAATLRMSAWQALKLRTLSKFVESTPKSSGASNPNWQGYRVNPLKSVVQLMNLQQALKPKLASIRQPVRVFMGRHDQTIGLEGGQMIIDRIASEDKSLHWLETSGHIILLEDELPEITDLTLQFLRQHAAVSP
jgi:carboxylesterase